MKKFLILIALVGGLVIPAAANAKSIYIGCATTAGSTIHARVAPRTCSTWYLWVDHAHSHNFQRLHWRHWGAYRATATGVDVYTGMGVTTKAPVRATVSRPRGFDGYANSPILPAYSRMTVRYPDGWHSTVSLAWGFDIWPTF
jgi:hypothetical protein